MFKEFKSKVKEEEEVREIRITLSEEGARLEGEKVIVLNYAKYKHIAKDFLVLDNDGDTSCINTRFIYKIEIEE